MKGSKYTEGQRETALALIASGKSATAAARELKIPKSTVCHWHNTALEHDEDFIAARTEARRAMVKKCNKIVKGSLVGVERKITAANMEMQEVQRGIKVLRKAAQDGVIALDETEIAAMKKIVNAYTGISIRELTASMKDVAAMGAGLEAQIQQRSEGEGVQVVFDDEMEAFAI